jgi:gliding motility-associated protein GldC
MKTNQLIFEVTTDEMNLPENITWKASDNPTSSDAKSVMIALWDRKELNTLRVDLWTKDMSIDEMKVFFHQNLVSLTETYKRATGDKNTADEMLAFLQNLGIKMGLFKK